MAASELLKDIDIKECIQTAVELKNLLTFNPTELVLPKTVAMKNNKIVSLRSGLSKFDWLNTDHYLEGQNPIEADKLKRIFLITYQLLAELNQVDNYLQNKQINEGTKEKGKNLCD